MQEMNMIKNNNRNGSPPSNPNSSNFGIESFKFNNHYYNIGDKVAGARNNKS